MTTSQAPKYEMNIFWSAEDEVFVVEVPDLPGCMAHGDTPADAAAQAQVAIEGWLAVTKEMGRDIPEPRRHRALA